MERRDFLRLLGLLPVMSVNSIAQEFGVLPVEDEDKKFKDSRLNEILVKNHMRKEFVEFTDDYVRDDKSKRYRDRITGREVVSFSGLPMRRMDDGTKVIPSMTYRNNVYEFDNNLFEGYIDTQGRVVIASVYNKKEMYWTPKLYVGTEEVSPVSFSLLNKDPLNSNYSNNTIEIDYGICLRRIRIIEGKFIGSWLITGTVESDVHIDYGADGKYLKLGNIHQNNNILTIDKLYTTNTEEYISKEQWIPGFIINDSYEFSITDDGGNGTIDGFMLNASDGKKTSGVQFSSLRSGAAGTTMSAYPSASNTMIWASIYASDNSLWWVLYGGGLIFNTSSLGASFNISSAYLNMYGSSNLNSLQFNTDLVGMAVCDFTPNSYNTFIPSDFGQRGSNIFASRTCSNYTLSYMTDNLNAAGLSYIKKESSTAFFLRELYYDVGGNNPTWHSGTYFGYEIYQTQMGTDYKPILTVVEGTPNTNSKRSLINNPKLMENGNIFPLYKK